MDGKDHRYCSIVENRRLPVGKTAQRTVLYLGEINAHQQASWRKTLEVFDEAGQRFTTLSWPWRDTIIPGPGRGARTVLTRFAAARSTTLRRTDDD